MLGWVGPRVGPDVSDFSKNLFLMQEVESLALTKTVNRTEFLLFINATRFDPLGVSSG